MLVGGLREATWLPAWQQIPCWSNRWPDASWEFTLCPQINDPVLNSAGRRGGGVTAAFRHRPVDARSQPDLITFKHFDADVVNNRFEIENLLVS